MRSLLVRARRADADRGFTLPEMLIVMIILFTVMAVAMTVLVSSNATTKTAADETNLNEEARQAINRLARDIRQATSVVSAVNPDGPAFSATSVTAVRIQADFNGDGCIGTSPLPGTSTACLPYSAANPEDITYCFDPSVRQLYIIDNGATPAPTPITSTSTSCNGGQPLLAGNVAGFKVEYRSNDYHYDSNGDGITTWSELDSYGPPVGDKNNKLDDELPVIDSVVLNLTMNLNGHTQLYRTQVDLRNRS